MRANDTKLLAEISEFPEAHPNEVGALPTEERSAASAVDIRTGCAGEDTQLINDMDNLLASLAMDTIFLDENLNIRRVAPGSGAFFALRPHDVGRPITAVHHALDYPELVTDLQRVLTSATLIEREVRDERGHWYFLRVLPYRSGDAVTGALLTLEDISRRKRAAERVQAELRRRDEFLAMLSHELRNPLAAIVNAIQILRRLGHHATSYHPYLNILDRQSACMSRLLDDLLDVTRLTHNKFELRRSVFDLRKLVANATQAVETILLKRKVNLSIEMSVEPLWVDADAARLEQVLVNLLNNAIKYNHFQGRVWLTLSSESGKQIMRVRDNGIGISHELLPTIFDLFVQGDQGIERAAGGMGVGLTLVRHIVELHGGHVTAHSAGLGYGAEFFITLPQAPEMV